MYPKRAISRTFWQWHSGVVCDLWNSVQESGWVHNDHMVKPLALSIFKYIYIGLFVLLRREFYTKLPLVLDWLQKFITFITGLKFHTQSIARIKVQSTFKSLLLIKRLIDMIRSLKLLPRFLPWRHDIFFVIIVF